MGNSFLRNIFWNVEKWYSKGAVPVSTLEHSVYKRQNFAEILMKSLAKLPVKGKFCRWQVDVLLEPGESASTPQRRSYTLADNSNLKILFFNILKMCLSFIIMKLQTGWCWKILKIYLAPICDVNGNESMASLWKTILLVLWRSILVFSRMP